MVYNIQDYWVFGLRPSSRILKDTEEHGVSETGSLSFLRLKVGDTYLNHWTLSNRPSRVGVPHTSPEDGNRSSPESLHFLLSCRIPDDGQSPKT
jgi:hypothetical protein